MSKPRVAIVTSLVDFNMAYSLNGIILDQCRMLKRAGYDYTLFCLRAFNKRDMEAASREGLNVEYVLAQTVLHEYGERERPLPAHEDKDGNQVAGFEEQVEAYFSGDKTGKGYKEVLGPYDVVITHDLMYLDWHLPQNAAIRRAIDLWPEKNWIHWVHSGPSSRPDVNEDNPRDGEMCYPTTLRYSASPHSIYVFLNHGKAQDFANMIQADQSIVRVVTNPKDVRVVFDFQPETRLLIDRYGLMDHQILQTYAFSTPRWDSKGLENLLAIWKHWKAMGVRAKLVLVNAHCNRDVNKPQVAAIVEKIKRHNLKVDEDVILTSRFGEEKAAGIEKLAEATTDKDMRSAYKAQARAWLLWKYSVPERVVRDLVLLGNMFVFPSETECCSLIQAEASLAGKFMVLNRDFGPMLEYCTPGVLHYEFTRFNNFDDPDVAQLVDDYHEDVAKEIWANFQHDMAVVNSTRAKTRTYNPDRIFREEFEPLLYLKFADKVAARDRGEEKPAPVVAPAEESNPERSPWEDPKPGQVCPIYGMCSDLLRGRCYDQAGHCFMFDETRGPSARDEEKK